MPENENTCSSCAEGAHSASKPLANNSKVQVAPYTPPTQAELEFTRQYYAARASMETGAIDRLVRESALPVQSMAWNPRSQNPAQALYDGVILPDTNHLMADPKSTASKSQHGAESKVEATQHGAISHIINRALLGEDVLMSFQLAAPWLEHVVFTQPGQTTESEPAPPLEPATAEDCDRWAQEYLEWLKNNGELKSEDRIVIRCNDKTYVFRRAPEGDEWDWLLDIWDASRELEKAITDQLGNPAPSGEWNDPDKPNDHDYDESWPNPAEKADRDEQGNIIKKVIGTAERCDLLKIRVLDHREWYLTRDFEFEYTYIVADVDGKANPVAAERQRAEQHRLFERQLNIVAGTGVAEPAWPTEEELVASVTRLHLLIIGKRYFVCESPCKMDVKLLGLKNVIVSTAAEAPLGEDSWLRRLSAATRVTSRVKQNGFWRVTILSEGKVAIAIEGDIEFEVYCKE